jgi:hypothetical protein
MKKYHKIQTVFKRDPDTKFKTLIEEDYSLPEFEYLKNNQWEYTEKVDGMNTRVMFDGENITFGGKTDKSQIPSDLVNKLNSKFLPEIKLFEDNFKDGVCLYGEGYGAKIQKSGGNYRPDQSFVLFDVMIGDWWLQRKDVESIAATLGIKVVPIIGHGTLSDMIERTRAGFNSQWGEFQAEGIVARPAVELKARDGQRIITKIKYKDFQRK